MSTELYLTSKASAEVFVADTKPPEQFLRKMLATELSLEEISAQLLEGCVQGGKLGQS